MKRKPVKGEVLYDLNVGNAARHCEQVLKPTEVIKVGRKYFTCKHVGGWQETEYEIGTWRQKTNYTADHFLYESVQERADEVERYKITDRLRNIFGPYSDLPLETLRKLQDILDPEQPL